MNMVFQDRWYQNEAVDSWFNYFASGKTGNPVISLPTGTGKSIVIGRFIQRAMQQYPGQRFMVLTHVKELVKQNAHKLQSMWPTAPMGVYSAGLNQRDTVMPIIFGGVGSVVNCTPMFGHRDLLIIDEAHLLSPKDGTMYQEVIHNLKQVNPRLKVLGLTATPFRLGQGYITDGGIFTDICYDQTSVEGFNRLIAEGFLSPLVPRRTNVEVDVSQVHINKGEYQQSELQEAVDRVIYAALTQVCQDGQDRQSWLIFADGIENSEKIATMLAQFGVRAAAIHSKLPGKERDRRFAAFKSGDLRCIVGKNIFTTGFDHPPVDLIGMLRPTLSPGLWVQMLGRGTRPSPDTRKNNCLVLDFAGNTRRLGPINDPKIPQRKGKGGGDAPVKLCPHCDTYNHAAARVCTFCGEEFEFETKLVEIAGTEELIRSDAPVVEMFDVQHIYYYLQEKYTKHPAIKAVYDCGLQQFEELVCIEHEGYPGKKARDWWRSRYPGSFIPESTQSALDNVTQLRVPSRIKVHINRKYPEVIGYEYNA